MPSPRDAHLKARLAEVDAALAELQGPTVRLVAHLAHVTARKFRQAFREAVARPVQPDRGKCRAGPGVLRSRAAQKAEAALQRARGEMPRKAAATSGICPAPAPGRAG